MSDTVDIDKARGVPVVTVRLRYTYEDDTETLRAAMRELEKEIVRLRSKRT